MRYGVWVRPESFFVEVDAGSLPEAMVEMSNKVVRCKCVLTDDNGKDIELMCGYKIDELKAIG